MNKLSGIAIINAIINDPEFLESVRGDVDEAQLAFHDAHLAFSTFAHIVTRKKEVCLLKFLETNNLYIEFTTRFSICGGGTTTKKTGAVPLFCRLRNVTTNQIVVGSNEHLCCNVVGYGNTHRAAVIHLCQSLSQCTTIANVGKSVTPSESTSIIPLSFSLDNINFPVDE